MPYRNSPAVRAYNTACQAELNEVPGNVRAQISSEMAFLQSAYADVLRAVKGGARTIPNSYATATMRWTNFINNIYPTVGITVVRCLMAWSHSIDPVYTPSIGVGRTEQYVKP